MSRLDQLDDVAPRLNLPKLKMRASEYMKTRVFHGFIDDSAAELAIPYVGVDRILWGSDFPHIRSMGLDALSRRCTNNCRPSQKRIKRSWWVKTP